MGFVVGFGIIFIVGLILFIVGFGYKLLVVLDIIYC